MSRVYFMYKYMIYIDIHEKFQTEIPTVSRLFYLPPSPAQKI
ncbi:hypothetical protein ECDEC12B_3621 [Escherichia coli DEC12B]|nr:hypothetical protein ECDEC12B_3621 [Escherichia coli DEC12B]